MAYLFCMSKPFEDLRFNLKELCRIGREPDNDIALDDGTISGYHCRIIHLNGHWEVQDLGSTNGITVNDEEMLHAVLKPGDLLLVGSIQFRFVDDEPAPAPRPEPEPVESVPDSLPPKAAPVDPLAMMSRVMSRLDNETWYLVVAVGGFILLVLGILVYLKLLWSP